MIFQGSVIEILFTILFRAPSFLIIILGLIWVISIFYDSKRRESFKKIKINRENFEVLKYSEILAYLVTINGLVVFITSDISFLLNFAIIQNGQIKIVNLTTSIFFMILSLLTILKPFYRETKISILGVLTAFTASILTTILIPDHFLTLIDGIINPRELLFLVLLPVFVVLLISIVFFTEKIILISRVLSWPPTDLTISILCLILGLNSIFG